MPEYKFQIQITTYVARVSSSDMACTVHAKRTELSDVTISAGSPELATKELGHLHPMAQVLTGPTEVIIQS